MQEAGVVACWPLRQRAAKDMTAERVDRHGPKSGGGCARVDNAQKSYGFRQRSVALADCAADAVDVQCCMAARAQHPESMPQAPGVLGIATRPSAKWHWNHPHHMDHIYAAPSIAHGKVWMASSRAVGASLCVQLSCNCGAALEPAPEMGTGALARQAVTALLGTAGALPNVVVKARAGKSMAAASTREVVRTALAGLCLARARCMPQITPFGCLPAAAKSCLAVVGCKARSHKRRKQVTEARGKAARHAKQRELTSRCRRMGYRLFREVQPHAQRRDIGHKLLLVYLRTFCLAMQLALRHQTPRALEKLQELQEHCCQLPQLGLAACAGFRAHRPGQAWPGLHCHEI